MAAVALARRVYADAPWGIRLYPNLYMMFIADTTFYRKTTAYKLGERILTTAIPHLLMPTPGSPERFQDALAGHAPSNFGQLPQEHQALVLEAVKFAAQRGLFKDEIAGLFGAFKRDYMSGMKDFILEIFDCPDFIAKETQSGLAIIRHAAPSILGVTTPAGLSGAVSHADWDNGLLPRFALLTPEPDYRERPGLRAPTGPPLEVVKGLRQVYDALPMPERQGDGWKAARALPMAVEVWDAVQAYSNALRRQCDPRRETPLDDRLKGVYGRLHVQAVKVAEILRRARLGRGRGAGPAHPGRAALDDGPHHHRALAAERPPAARGPERQPARPAQPPDRGPHAGAVPGGGQARHPAARRVPQAAAGGRVGAPDRARAGARRAAGRDPHRRRRGLRRRAGGRAAGVTGVTV